MKTLMIMAGGTGGHVYPALAVAALLRDRGIEIIWLGTRNGLEASAVPAQGFPIEWINVKGLRGKGLLGWLISPALIAKACFEASRIIRRHRPDALLGMGGFVSGPGGLVAWIMRLPLLIHEQNAIAGLTNRGLSRFAARVFSGFPGVLPRAEHLGNPVRQEFIDIANKREYGRENRPLRLLVVGGSQGAVALNEVVPAAIAQMDKALRPTLRHQSGRARADTVRQAYQQHAVEAQVDEFIDDMACAYAWADVVVCRAGAMTVAEVSVAAVAAIFVPFPYAVGDHQSANARYLSDNDAAILVDQSALTPARLSAELNALAEQPERIQQLGSRARELAPVNATTAIAQACMEVLHA